MTESYFNMYFVSLHFYYYCVFSVWCVLPFFFYLYLLLSTVVVKN